MHVGIFAGMSVLQRQQALQAAQQAYLDLSMGKKVVNVSYTQGDGGKSATFTAAEIGNLTMLIKQLQVSLGMMPRARRPMRFIY